MRSASTGSRRSSGARRRSVLIRLFVNATVLTLDPTFPVAQALAVRDGRIVEVGGTDEILWLREREYELVDLAGRCVIPGFVDPHNHFSIGALDTLWTDVTGATSVESIQRALAGAARRAPAGLRSEERRVGKEGRSGGALEHGKKKNRR